MFPVDSVYDLVDFIFLFRRSCISTKLMSNKDASREYDALSIKSIHTLSHFIPKEAWLRGHRTE